MQSFSHVPMQSYRCRAKEMKLECELGRGAFGAVYKMRHRTKGSVMAVKVSGLLVGSPCENCDQSSP